MAYIQPHCFLLVVQQQCGIDQIPSNTCLHYSFYERQENQLNNNRKSQVNKLLFNREKGCGGWGAREIPVIHQFYHNFIYSITTNTITKNPSSTCYIIQYQVKNNLLIIKLSIKLLIYFNIFRKIITLEDIHMSTVRACLFISKIAN